MNPPRKQQITVALPILVISPRAILEKGTGSMRPIRSRTLCLARDLQVFALASTSNIPTQMRETPMHPCRAVRPLVMNSVCLRLILFSLAILIPCVSSAGPTDPFNNTFPSGFTQELWGLLPSGADQFNGPAVLPNGDVWSSDCSATFLYHFSGSVMDTLSPPHICPSGG